MNGALESVEQSLRGTILLPVIGRSYTMAGATAEVIRLHFDYRARLYLVYYRYDTSAYLPEETHFMNAQSFADHFSGRFKTVDDDLVEFDADDFKPGGSA